MQIPIENGTQQAESNKGINALKAGTRQDNDVIFSPPSTTKFKPNVSAERYIVRRDNFCHH
jgi:hypothetical protein